MPKAVVIKGMSIRDDIPFRDASAHVALAGFDGAGRAAFLPVGDTLIGRHALLLGGGGYGKTNMLITLARGLRASLAPEDMLVMLDPGGAYRKAVFQKGDIAPDAQNGWNLFEELSPGESLIGEADALVGALFAERLRQSVARDRMAAARDLMMALIVYLKRGEDCELRNNRALRALIDGFDAASMRDILESQPELRAFAAYLSEDEQTLGVASELTRAAREILCGEYAAEGSFSVRAAMRARGGKALLLPCDPAKPDRSAVAAMCGLCVDEALAYTGEGKTYLLLDGLCAMPAIARLRDALLMGRDRGLRLVICASDMPALVARYGADIPALLASAGAVVAFRTMDRESRAFVKALYGRHRVIEGYRPAASYSAIEHVVDEYLIGDEELSSLGLGESIIAAFGLPPFRFRLKPFIQQQTT